MKLHYASNYKMVFNYLAYYTSNVFYSLRYNQTTRFAQRFAMTQVQRRRFDFHTETMQNIYLLGLSVYKILVLLVQKCLNNNYLHLNLTTFLVVYLRFSCPDVVFKLERTCSTFRRIYQLPVGNPLLIP